MGSWGSSSREFPEKAPPRITVFQSEHFIDGFPPKTLELAGGHLGQLVITPSRLGDNHREPSLALMRQMMFERSGLVAAVFAGGMNGIFDEAVLFERLNPSLPTYAVGSAEGAARDLLHLRRPLGKGLGTLAERVAWFRWCSRRRWKAH